MDIPIVTIQVDRMRHTLQMALMEHSKLLGDEMQKAVNEAVQPEAIAYILRKEVEDHLNRAVKEEVRNFFNYSAPGRQAIKQAVYEHLEMLYPSEAVNEKET